MVVGVGPKVMVCVEDDVDEVALELATEGMS